MKKAFLIAVGSELLNFKSNTYSPLFASRLRENGIILSGEISALDDKKSIKNALVFASKEAHIIIVCGGLGPTFDDLTRQAVSEFLNTPLIYSTKIEKFLSSRYPDFHTKQNLKNQCLIIKNAKLIENRNGTAFGQVIRKGKKIYILLPGPRNEWEPMWNDVERFLKSRRKIFFKRFRFADLRETEVENLIMPNIKEYSSLQTTVLAGPNICELSITSESKRELIEAEKKIHKIACEFIFSCDSQTLEEKVGELLKKKRLTISTAESCTGGLLGSTITDVPGSSTYYKGGVNAYSNEIKIKILGVRKSTITKYGAVSEQTVREMALNVKKIFSTDCALSISGIAGPGGGSQQKPVGTVFICSVYGDKIKLTKKIFSNRSRDYIKKAAVNTALWHLYKMLK
ncbi:MAG: nicotinamide-nucleotide amidohydrolase family protein [Elusimicrobiales bacterium]